MSGDTEPMFDAPEPVPAIDRFEGLGQDAARTARQHDLLADRIHPATRMPLHLDAPDVDDRMAPGPRCGSCSRRYIKLGTWSKCKLASAQQKDGPDLRQWWPACNLFVSRLSDQLEKGDS